MGIEVVQVVLLNVSAVSRIQRETELVVVPVLGEAGHKGQLVGRVVLQGPERVEPCLIVGLVVSGSNVEEFSWDVNERFLFTLSQKLGSRQLTGDIAIRLIHGCPQTVEGDTLGVLGLLVGPEVGALVVHPIKVDNILTKLRVDQEAIRIARMDS